PPAVRLTRAGRPARVPLSPAQQRMWLLQALEPDSTDYHVCGALRVHGALDLERLAAALTQTVARHEALRTCFPRQDGQACQVVLPPAAVAVERLSVDIDADRASPAAHDAAVQARIDAWEAQRFDLETGPLLKAAYLPLAADDGYLLLNLHHIIADGRSIAILLDDIAARYADLREAGAGADAPGAPDAPHYADYCVWSRSEAAREREAASLPFWRTQLAGAWPAGIAALRPART
ncbi:condensation domain-containing protein, partial [Burkholderia pseudomallei]